MRQRRATRRRGHEQRGARNFFKLRCLAGEPDPHEQHTLGHEDEADSAPHAERPVDQRRDAEHQEAAPGGYQQRHCRERGRARSADRTIATGPAITESHGREANGDAKARNRPRGREERLGGPAKRRELARGAATGPANERRGQQRGHDPDAEDRSGRQGIGEQGGGNKRNGKANRRGGRLAGGDSHDRAGPDRKDDRDQDEVHCVGLELWVRLGVASGLLVALGATPSSGWSSFGRMPNVSTGQ